MISDNTILSEKNVEYIINQHNGGHIVLDYLEANGEQYINTEYTPNNNSRIIATVSPTKITNIVLPNGHNYSGIFYGSGYPNYTDASMECYVYSADTNADASGAGITGCFGKENVSGSINVLINDVLVSDFNKNQLTVYRNNELVYSHDFSNQAFTSNRTLNIFALNRQVNYYGGCRIYNLKIYDNDILVRDFIPVLKDGTPAMYDAVNTKYYYNNGTGDFLYTVPDMPTLSSTVPATFETLSTLLNYESKPNYDMYQISSKNMKHILDKIDESYDFLEYIQTGSGQYIDSSYRPTQNTGINFDFQLVSWINSDWNEFFGCRNYNTSAIAWYDDFALWAKVNHNNNPSLYSYWNNENNVIAVAAMDKNRHVFQRNSEKIYFDNSYWASHPSGTFSAENTIWFGRADTPQFPYPPVNMRIYDIRITEKTGDEYLTVKHFVPAIRNGDGEIGLYETISKEFFVSSHGKFVDGPRIKPYVVPSDYLELEYVASDGTNYVDLGIPFFGTDGIDTIVGFYGNAPSGYHTVWGCRDANSGANAYRNAYGLWLYQQANTWEFEYFSNMYNNGMASVTPSAMEKYHVISEGGYLNIINWHSKQVFSPNAGQTTGSVYLFAVHNVADPVNHFAVMKMYNFKLKRNGQYILDLIPVKRISDNVPGLLDKINGKFYSSASSTPLIAGPEL